MHWVTAISTFAASFVESVEAFTIVLVVGVTINWRSAFVGTIAALALLALLVGVFGTTLLQLIPIETLRLVIGTLLLLFGLKWLKKAIMRYAGLKALHDEEAIYEHEVAALRARGERVGDQINSFGVAMVFKSVLLEGLEVVFIVLTFGLSAVPAAGETIGGMESAAIGALAAVALVAIVGAIVHRPLQQVPENTLKWSVGLMLTLFGTFWAGEGLGIVWPGGDLALLWIGAIYVALSFALVTWLRGQGTLAKVAS